MSIHGVLGQATSYPKDYNSEVLYPIARAIGRDSITCDATNFDPKKLTLGVDWWHAFEVSWLNPNGISQVAVARFTVPADSANIVESKSLKLYLNSLNFTEFASLKAVQNTIARDLSDCVQAVVKVELFDLTRLTNPSKINETGLQIDYPQGRCIDDALDGQLNGQKLPLFDHPQSKLLASLNNDAINSDLDHDYDHDYNNDQKSRRNAAQYSVAQEKVRTDLKTYQLYTNLLRSNCPVTNQPDWGRVAIDMTTDTPLKEANVLAYILSYRQHNGFHEQCVEQIFTDLTQYFEPTKLMVRAWYTRRGGIDINPCRVSDMSLLPAPSRLIRQ